MISAFMCLPTTSCRIMASNRYLDPMLVVDFSQLQQHSRCRSLAIKDLGKACETPGCFQVINHGVHKSVIDSVLEVSTDFSDLSMDAKSEFASEDISKPVRYGTGSKDGISKTRDVLKLYAYPFDDWVHLWPAAPHDYREKMGNYANEIRRVALQLLGAILESLGLGEAYLKDKFEEGLQVMVTNFYPQGCKSELAVGLDSHSDHGFITILLQRREGLQVRDLQGNWKIVRQLPDALHVHIGDHLEVLTNGRYKSVVHRAILNSDVKRISIASIHNFPMEEKVSPVKELVNEQVPKSYNESSFRDFLDYLSTRNGRKEGSFLDDLRI